jgi:protein-S-isoprenylcysteine O-methyltransferase Ste14
VREWLAGPLPERFILLCWAVFFAYWLIAAFGVKRTIEASGGWVWRLAVVAAAVIVITRREQSGHWWSPSAVWWEYSTPVGVVGAIIVALGLATALWARRSLGGNWSGLVALKENHELVERGPYRYVRHPIYSGILLMVLGTAIVSGRASWFLAFFAVFIGVSVKARAEERLLTKHFPEAYPSYRRRVKALIPFII